MNPYSTVTASEAKKMIFDLYRELIIAGNFESDNHSGLDKDEVIAREALGRADTAILEFLLASNTKIIDDSTGKEWSGIYFLSHNR